LYCLVIEERKLDFGGPHAQNLNFWTFMDFFATKKYIWTKTKNYELTKIKMIFKPWFTSISSFYS
jgi:hypothetical protein